jgi:hypothetical protein
LSDDSAEKKWVGSVFRPDISFVLRLQKVGDQSPERYIITVTPHGERFAQPCISVGDGTAGDNVQVYSRALVVCSTLGLLEMYQFNLMNNRFTSYYLQGYVDGVDNNNNAPQSAAERALRSPGFPSRAAMGAASTGIQGTFRSSQVQCYPSMIPRSRLYAPMAWDAFCCSRKHPRVSSSSTPRR